MSDTREPYKITIPDDWPLSGRTLLLTREQAVSLRARISRALRSPVTTEQARHAALSRGKQHECADPAQCPQCRRAASMRRYRAKQ